MSWLEKKKKVLKSKIHESLWFTFLQLGKISLIYGLILKQRPWEQEVNTMLLTFSNTK